MEALRQLTTIGFDDLPLFGAIVIAYGVYRYILSYFILAYIGRILCIKQREKFIHRSFDLVHYSVSALLGCFAVLGRPYGHCVHWGLHCSDALAPTAGACVCTTMEKIYYMVFCAYYVVDVLYIWTVRNDMLAVSIHHAITVSMILLSVYVHVPAIGLVIMLLHDVVDVPLYLGKVFAYAGFSAGKEVALLLFASMCTWFRMINLPTIIWHAWTWIPESVFPKLHTLTCVMLLVLMACHIHWFIKIVKAGINIFSAGGDAIRDTRSD
jgi:hypothetical protein